MDGAKQVAEDEETPWIEDVVVVAIGEESNGNDSSDFGASLFSVDERSPTDIFELTVSSGMTVRLCGIKSKYPHLLQSTGMALWEGSQNLCNYLASHTLLIRGKDIVELGAGLGLCGIVAHKLGAKQVVLTDGDSDTLAAMRCNVAANVNPSSSAVNDVTGPPQSILCKQLIWGRHDVGVFCQTWALEGRNGFDVVMGGDIAYAQESLEILFETALALLSKKSSPDVVFLLSFVFRGGVTAESMYDCAQKHGLDCIERPEDGKDKGVYVFSRTCER